jgi:hypothetical protein
MLATHFLSPLISDFRRDVDEICVLLGDYTASCGNYLPTFSRQRIGPIFTGQDSK